MMRTQLIPQTSVGRLVSLNIDGHSREYTPRPTQSAEPEIPALLPLSLATANNTTNDDNGEKTMMWTNIARLFSKTDNHDAELQECNDTLTRISNDIIQELLDVKTELADVQQKQSSQVRKIKKYVNRKCDNLRENVTYGSFNADNEIFLYINKIRAEMDERFTKLEMENEALREELAELHQTYDKDYNEFVNRENELMAKLDAVVKLSESVNQRAIDCEFTFTKQIQNVENNMKESQFMMAGDLREEFAYSISRSIECDSNTNVKLIQSVNDEMTELITKSNEFHSYRYFSLLEEMKNTRSDYEGKLETLKKSIGMVDAELSDTKEKLEFLTEEVAQASNDVYDVKENLTETKDCIYREMNRDYYDLKDYVKNKVRQESKKLRDTAATSSSKSLSNLTTNVIEAIIDPIQVIAEEYADDKNVFPEQDEDENVIIMDADMFRSEDSDIE